MLSKKQKVSTMLEDFDRPTFVVNEQTYNKKIENSIVSDIINDKKIDFPTDTDHISLPNSAKETKQQKINEDEMFLKTELKKGERYWDIRKFNWWDKTWIVKNFYRTRRWRSGRQQYKCTWLGK